MIKKSLFGDCIVVLHRWQGVCNLNFLFIFNVKYKYYTSYIRKQEEKKKKNFDLRGNSMIPTSSFFPVWDCMYLHIYW